VNFYQLTQNLIHDTLGSLLVPFRPELTLVATIVALLLVRMLDRGRKIDAFYVMVIGSALALAFTAPWQHLQGEPWKIPIFTGMLVFDTFSVYMRALLLFFVLLFATFTRTTGVPNRDDATEFYVLILGATLGMCLMVSAQHMLIVFLGIEMASVPSYALAGILRNRRTSSEAALKFAVFGAGTAGVMLYGISLLVGVLGSAHLPTMAVQLANVLGGDAGPQRLMVLALGGLMVMVGLAFKLSAVPFHFWAPDVFEGATAEVAAFLSIASKAAALALLVRLALGLGYVDPSLALVVPAATSGSRTDDSSKKPGVAAGANSPATNSDTTTTPAESRWAGGRQGGLVPPYNEQTAHRSHRETPLVLTAATLPLGPHPSSLIPHPSTAALLALAPARKFIAGLVALLAAVTCTFGNLAAYGQTNIKRLLAYSTIAHAGYMMMPVAAAVTLAGSDPEAARGAVAALAFYAGVYLFMNLGAFAFAAFLRDAIGSEEIASYAGLVRRSPGLAVLFSIVLFSLVGLPPLAGFAAKFTIFASLFRAGLLTLLVIGALNTVVSLFYYLRIVKVMILEPEPEERSAPQIPLWSPTGMYSLIITSPLLLLGVWWDGLFHWASAATHSLLF
jgi:NADH-quinone oxidoreductase subunit N